MNSDFEGFIKTPARDLKEETNRYFIRLNLSGAIASSLDVKLEGQKLSISIKTGGSSEQNGGDKNHYYRREPFYRYLLTFINFTRAG